MSRNTTINYIKKSLAQGYKPEQIRTALINAGHSPPDIDILLRATAYKEHKSKKLVIMAVILMIVTLIIVLSLFLLPEEKTPSIKLSLLETEIKTDNPLALKIQIINPAEKKTEVIMDLTVFSANGQLLSSKKTITTISQYITEIPAQIPINFQPGQYKILLTVSIGVYTLTKDQYFDITEISNKESPTQISSPTEQRKTTTKECIGGCDDYNICTKDECIEGECIYTLIKPCCGNNICETGEDQTCIDCINEEKTKEETKTADTVIRECREIATITERDICFETAAATHKINQICDEINDQVKRDSCYMDFALKKDYTVCEKIQNKYTRNSCFALSRMSA